ncbi:MAG TPA: hypothetical protein VHP31_04385 [Caproicibacter sp.]|nr:hypothetical protein [Caproicibacter sp.]
MKKAIPTLSFLAACILTAGLISGCGNTLPTPFSVAPVAVSSSQAASKTGGETISKEQQKKYEEIQNSVDNGHQPGWLNPDEVSMDFAASTLKTTNLSQMYDKIEKSVTGDHATVTFTKAGKPVMKMELYQPVKKGTGGIWAVTKWTDCKTNSEHTVG